MEAFDMELTKGMIKAYDRRVFEIQQEKQWCDNNTTL